jgi:Mlc titration factor MtfA (ptsG expression regulator)
VGVSMPTLESLVLDRLGARAGDDLRGRMLSALRARLARAREARLLRRHPLADADWEAVVAALPPLARLSGDELGTLRRLATCFAHRTTFVGTHDLRVTPYMKTAVAAQACLPILNLGLDWYRDLRTVVLYPGPFVADRQHEDEIGVVHEGFEELDGESMERGPLALSWEEADPDRPHDGTNVVLHECAHKLDELDGAPNGLPPLHPGMAVADWAAAFSAAFEGFGRLIDAQADDLPFDDYAATDPAEFFAVMTETFFETPERVRDVFPDVYRQLVRFYRQDPAARNGH